MTVGIYAADGSINVTVVDGSTYTGLYAADGSYNVVVNDGSTYTGSTHPCGAYNVVVYTSGQPTLFAPNGSFYVSVSPYTEGTLKVTTVSGGFGDFTLTWDGDTADNTPDFTVTGLPALVVGDVVTLYFNGTPYANTIDAGETALLSLDFATGSQLNGTYSAYATHVRGGTTLTSNTVSVTINVPLVAPVNTVAPVISGVAVSGATLTATTGTWTGYYTPTYTYQWKRDGSNIGGATNSTYVLTETDEGTDITCAVTGTNTAGSATATSNTISVPVVNVSYTHIGEGYDNLAYGSSTKTFTKNFGTISSTKKALLFVSVGTAVVAQTPSISIDGVSVSSVVSESGAGYFRGIYAVDIATGGSKDIVISSTVALAEVCIGVGYLSGAAASATATDKFSFDYRAGPVTLFDGSSGNGAGTQSIPSGGIGVVMGFNYSNTNPVSFSGSAVTHYSGTPGGTNTLGIATYSLDADPIVTSTPYGGDFHFMAAWAAA